MGISNSADIDGVPRHQQVRVVTEQGAWAGRLASGEVGSGMTRAAR